LFDDGQLSVVSGYGKLANPEITGYSGCSEAVMTITISISDDRAKELQAKADRLGLKVEDFARLLVEKAADGEIDESSPEFDRELDYIMTKNAELYRRLA
jgi:hypothetical protein